MNPLNFKIHKIGQESGHNILTIASGKGGVGKTWFATTIADALGRSGKRVLLFDGDLGLANVDVQLGINPKRDLSGVATGRYSFKEAITSVDNAAFDLLPGRSGSGILTSLKPEKLISIRNTLQESAKHYDWVIADLGGGIDKPVRLLTNGNGIILVITNSEPTSLTDAYAFIKVTNMKFPGSDIRIVVNMAKSRKEGDRTYSILANSCSNFLKITPKLAGIIRQDHCVNDAIRNQAIMLYRFPSANASSDVRAIRKEIENNE